jgi:ectoine hydroxylase-related dioxygenase (phytanoyl-CoA dioxygenase family)
MDIGTALRELGVSAGQLTLAEKARLDEDGFLPLPGILSAGQLQVIRRRLAELSAAEGERAGTEVHQEEGTDRLADLVNKDPAFEVCFTCPRVLAAMAHVLGDFTLSSLNSRAVLPGRGQQRLHADWGAPVEPGNYRVCNSIWLIDDFTESNGPTRVVPGSHRSGQLPRDVMADPTGPHPGEVKILGSAGTVVIFNSHLWHGGTQNTSRRPRRALHAYFCRRGLKQQLDQRAYARPQTLARLSPAAQYILGVTPAGEAAGLSAALGQRSLAVAAWYCSTTLAGMRPRSLTARPWSLAHARMSPLR